MLFCIGRSYNRAKQGITERSKGDTEPQPLTERSEVQCGAIGASREVHIRQHEVKDASDTK
jgi:hypothetical protein